MKALWKGSIGFALVNIPVRLYSAARKTGASFHMLHKKCSTPLNYERHCGTCNVNVPWEEVAHGYEYEKGKYVVVTEEEIEAIPLKSAKSIDIIRFVEEKEIEPIYYDRPYYLEPEAGAERAYALLRETMRGAGRVALSKVAFREKEHMAVIRVYGDALILHTLLYAEEVAKPEALNIPGGFELDSREIALAGQLLRHFSGKFDIAAYRDEFKDALTKIISDKIEGREIKVPARREAAKVVSLMEALKKSVESGKRKAALPAKTTPQAKRKAVHG